MKCKECGRDNPDYVRWCEGCGANLDIPETKDASGPGLVRVAVLDHEVEAERLGVELEAQQIPHALISYRDSAWDGVYQTSKGWGCVEAPAEQAEAIRDILERIRAAARQADATEGAAEDP